MNLSLAIQHHPRREGLLPRLLTTLEPARADVVADPDPGAAFPSPWRTHRRALEETPAGATHRLVLQDDAEPCPGFAAAMDAAVRAQPDRMIAFCVCGEPRTSAKAVERAARAGDAWAVVDAARWVPTIALLWPVRLIGPALEFVDAQAWPAEFRADDEIAARVARALGETVLATVPSLVQHADLVPSIVGRRAAGGRNPGRVAAVLLPDGADPLGIDWTLGPR